MVEDIVMRIYDFKVLLEPDETGGYVAVCPALPGCYSQGDTVAEAMANIKEAIDGNVPLVNNGPFGGRVYSGCAGWCCNVDFEGRD